MFVGVRGMKKVSEIWPRWLGVSSSSGIQFLFLFFCILLLLVCVRIPRIVDLINSDTLTWPTFWKDILEDGFSWRTWKYAPSPAFISAKYLTIKSTNVVNFAGRNRLCRYVA